MEAPLSDCGSQIDDLIAWLSAELGDFPDVATLARFLQNNALNWHAPTADAATFRTILAFTFGNRMDLTGNRAPGPVNEAIAAVVAEVQRRGRAIVYAQWEVAQPLVGLLPGATIIPVYPDRDSRAEPVYLGTQAVVRRVIGLAGGAEMLGSVGIVAFRDHLRRCVATARALGLDAQAPAGIPMPDRYDPLSGQPWCRKRLAYLLHDISVAAAERRDALCAQPD